MGSVLDFILDGLERALELERELGVRSVECDRTLLTVERREVQSPLPAPRSPNPEPRTPPPEPRPANHEPRTAKHEPRNTNHDLVFLHDRPLSAKGVEMMAKIVTAMGRTPETAPIIVEPPVPKQAKVVVVLGWRALKRYFPEMNGEPGQWLRTPDGSEMLVTYSPEYFLRFDTVTPAVKKLKHDMWHSLKAVVQRLG